jgi:hypothetical protein
MKFKNQIKAISNIRISDFEGSGWEGIIIAYYPYKEIEKGRLGSMRNIKFAILGFIVVFIVALTGQGPAQAVSFTTLHNDTETWGTPVDSSSWTDTYVSYSDGIYATGAWDNSGTKLAWSITESGGIYTYEYRWQTTSTPPAGNLSHIIIELTDQTMVTPVVGDVDGDPGRLNTEQQGNPGLPLDLWGIKILGDEGQDFSFSFTTTQVPVWGNFYAKSGVDTIAYNEGFGNYSPGSPWEGVFIARPDGLQVPEPGTLLLLGAGLLGLWVIRRRK